MNADQKLVAAETTERVLGCYYDAYSELGYGFAESVYENALILLLKNAGLLVAQQEPFEVRFRGAVVGEYRADLIVNREVIVEVKAVVSLAAVHEAQLVNYLKATGLEVGLLLNFGPKPQFKRRVLSKQNPRSSA